MTYEELIALYAKYKDQGLEILTFSCNQFLGQEPGTNEEVKARILAKWNVTWPMFSKIDINGPTTHPVYKFLRSTKLKNQTPDKNEIEWNFGKFIVDRNGQVGRRYGPNVPPSSLDTPDKLQAWLAGESMLA